MNGMDKILKRFGDTLRRQRQYVGISQEKLASKCKLHRTYVGSVERGERNVGLLNIVRIARALGVKPSFLLEDISGGDA
jgi:transcriptional regulator with XRE-family HTH domain